MTSRWKSYRVSFSVRDCYFIELKARNEDEAVQRAQNLYERHGESACHGFYMNFMEGGTDDWEAEQIIRDESPADARI